MHPEVRARLRIDALLEAAGWYLCDLANADIHAALAQFKLMAADLDVA